MNPKTLKALKESIAHWKRMKQDPKCGDEPAGWDCALCRRFNSFCHTFGGERYAFGGERCPVAAAAGSLNCSNTPYSSARDAWYYYHEQGGKTRLRQWRTAAQREIDFLESLLPKKKAKRKTAKPRA